MLNFVIGIALFALSSFFGLNYKKKCKERAKFYKELYEFNLHLSEQISYAKTPLPQIIISFAMLKDSLFAGLLKDFGKELNMGAQGDYAIKYIGENEKEEVLRFLRGLGKTDADNQLISLAEDKQWIKARKDSAENEEITKGKLYYKLAVILGIALLIIVI